MLLIGKRLDREEEGSATLEFALIIPLFFILFLAALDVIKILLAEEQLNILARDLAFHYKYMASSDDKKDLNQADLDAVAKGLASSSASFLIEDKTLSASSNVYADPADYVSGVIDAESGSAGESDMLVIYQLESSINLTSPLMMLVHDGTAVPIRVLTVSKHAP